MFQAVVFRYCMLFILLMLLKRVLGIYLDLEPNKAKLVLAQA